VFECAKAEIGFSSSGLIRPLCPLSADDRWPLHLDRRTRAFGDGLIPPMGVHVMWGHLLLAKSTTDNAVMSAMLNWSPATNWC
jgi:hypothetical protein